MIATGSRFPRIRPARNGRGSAGAGISLCCSSIGRRCLQLDRPSLFRCHQRFDRACLPASFNRYVHNLLKYEFDLQFEIPVTYPATAPELELPELDGAGMHMQRRHDRSRCEGVCRQPPSVLDTESRSG